MHGKMSVEGVDERMTADELAVRSEVRLFVAYKADKVKGEWWTGTAGL